MPRRGLTFYLTFLLVMAMLIGVGVRGLLQLPQGDVSKESLKHTLTAFSTKHPPIAQVRTEDLQQMDSTLLDPKQTLPRYFMYDRHFIKVLLAAEKTCRGFDGKELLSPAGPEKKLLTFTKYRCGFNSALSKTFLGEPPLMHPSGQSFAYLLASEPNLPWTKEELRPWMHILEMRGSAATTSEKIFSHLEPDALNAVWYRGDLAYGKTYTLLAHFSTEYLIYHVYDTTTFDAFMGAHFYVLSPWKKKNAVSYGNIYLSYDEASIRRDRWLYSGLTSMGILGLIAGSLLLLLRLRRLRNIETARRIFSFQMLAHELRSPVTALKIDVEQLVSALHALPQEAQKMILRVAQTTGRLGRLVQASTAYLQQGARSLHPDSDYIDDMSQYLMSVTQEVRGHEAVEMIPPAQTFAATCSPYWLEFMVHNLLQNALEHGKPPVMITWFEQAEKFCVTITDHGAGLQKNVAPSGLGLGLELTRTVIQELGGTLKEKIHPTTFELWLPRNPL